MSETMSVDTHDTSQNDAGEDPLADLSDDQLFQLVEDTLYVCFYASISYTPMNLGTDLGSNETGRRSST